MIENFVTGLVASAIVSIGLWLLLPRGVVITRNKPARDVRGEPIPDSWVLRNQSPLTVQILDVRYTGISTYANMRPAWKSLTPSELASEPFGVSLDSDVGGGAMSNDSSWSTVQLAPGDGLVLQMPLNHELEMRYRRAGWTGVFERRVVTIQGFA
ncbi:MULTISPECIES: hypothetical protein [Kocuria]|uniref:hypothetical protein n=1 Tax=Kocuria TaxID=57493 RepID=UPI000738D704|nr:hypothetical protein [Kocuria palustris]KUG54807.1 hypothetical protein AVL60_00100 [Kocuria palustris]